MFDLNTMTVDELIALRADVETALFRAQEELKDMARKEIQAIAEVHGISLDTLIGARKKGNGKVRKIKGAPKYYNPDNPEQTWTGKGTRPQWFLAAAMRGITPEHMLIP